MKKKKVKRGFRFLNIAIGFIFIYIMAIFWNQNSLMKDLETKKQEVQTEVDNIKNEIKELEEEIKDSESLQFVEKVAREDLGMVKPREIIYIDKNKKKDPFFKIIKKDN